MNTKNIIAIVLAGGEGKRFWPMTTYKSMVPFLGKTILEHNLEQLQRVGIVSVVIVVNPQDREAVSSLNISGLTIDTVVQEKPTGMADAVLQAKQIVGDRACLIMNAEDIVEDSLYRNIFHQTNDTDILVVGKKVTAYFPGGYLQVQDGKLVGIVEKPGAGHEPSDLVNLVFHYFPDASVFYGAIEQTKSDQDDVYEKALTSLFASHSAKVVVYDGVWQSLKYPWHILDGMKFFLGQLGSHKGKNVVIKSNVTIEGPVYIDDGVKIFEYTKIIGPCYIGKNTVIGNNTIIRESQIGADSVVGFSCDVTRSYIGDNCWLHSNYVGDSVLEANVSMGGGAKLANLRLDDGEISSLVGEKKQVTGKNKLGAIIAQGVRIGVNSSIMPGVKIGKNSFVGSGVVLEKDLMEDSYCVAQPGYTVKKNIHTASVSREEFKKKI